MSNYNKVILMGNLTRDPEMRVTPKGTAICQFGLAINRTWKDDAGAVHEEVTFVNIEAWGKQGELISKYCTKGRPLFVEGRLKFDQWEDKTSGQKRSQLKVVLENFQFIGSKPGEASGADGGSAEHSAPPARSAARPVAQAQPAAAGAGSPKDTIDDDVPFSQERI